MLQAWPIRCDLVTPAGPSEPVPHLVAQLVNANPGVAGDYFWPLGGDSVSENEVNVEESGGKPWNETDSCLQLKPAAAGRTLFLELVFCYLQPKRPDDCALKHYILKLYKVTKNTL